jgi:polyhydroxybutyrate depolymerase
MKPLTMIVWIITMLCLTNCMASLPKDVPPGSKTYKNKLDMRIMGSRRSYLVHIPPAAETRDRLPLVIAVHGAFETAKDMEKRSGFSQLADREGFVAVYPNGIGLFGFLQHWNAGHCCGKAAADGVDDVGFLAEVISDVQKRLRIDPQRIYMVGFSNGGMLTYRFAAENGEILSAFAVVASTIGSHPSGSDPLWRMPDPETPVPLIVFHGLADDAIPPRGGISPKRGGERSFLSVKDSTAFWVHHNGCNSEPVSSESRQNSVRIQTWKKCRQNAEVVVYLLKGWGHVWPGLYYTGELDKEDPLKGFDAAAIMWEFFESHSKTR